MVKEDYEIWTEGFVRANYPRKVLPSETEILIIGGGITGLTSAYLLAKENKKVVLLEKRKLGEWVTDCTTGFLTGVIDTDPIKLINIFGLEKAKLILNSHFDAISGIEEIINREKIDCEFIRCTNYIYANNRHEEKRLLKLAEAYQKLGINVLYKTDKKLGISGFGYLEMPNQAKFHAMKYLTSLAKLATEAVAIIAEDTEVLSVEDKGDYVSIEVKDVGQIKAKKVVSATHVPFKESKYLSGLSNMYRSYVVEYKLPAGIFVEGTYQDNQTPYHYFRIDRKIGFDRLIIGGADHLDIIKMDRGINFEVVRKYTNELFLNVNISEVRYWSGSILETNDGLAYIGESKEKNIFYIFGFSGNGMTYSYIAGKIFLDKIFGRENRYAEIYSLNRKVSWWKKLYYK